MSRLRDRIGRAARNALDDALAIAGVACLAVAAGFLAPAGPWLVVGLFLFVSAAAGKRGQP
jgi:hypothetical protein